MKTKITDDDYVGFEDIFFESFSCLNEKCSNELLMSNVKYCFDCGIELDWSEVSEKYRNS